MPRAKGGPKTRQRRKKRLKLAKGQYGGKSRLFRTATESVDKGQHICLCRAEKTQAEFPPTSGSRASMRRFARMG